MKTIQINNMGLINRFINKYFDELDKKHSNQLFLI